MVTISKVGDSTIKFEFTNNDHYLYNNGEISVPLNSLILVTDDTDLVVFKKIDGDVFVTFLIGNSNFSSKDELVAWYKENMVDGGGGSDITSGDVQNMIDESISGKADSSAVTEEISAAVSGKQDTLIAGENITISGNVISAEGGNNAIELTQAEYDVLVSGGTVDPTAFYIITDAVAFDPSTKVDTSAFTAYSAATNATLSGKADTSAVTAIQDSLSGYVATSAITTAVTSGSTDTEIPTAKAVYDAIPTGGTGGSYSAGTNISIDSANTISCTLPITSYSDNVLIGYAINSLVSNKNIVISTSTSNSRDKSKIYAENGISIGQNTTLSGKNASEFSIAIGSSSKVLGVQSSALGVGCSVSGNSSVAIGRYSNSNGNNSVAIGNQAMVSGDSSVAMGSGATANGIDYKMNLNNQIKVTPTNQVYISNSANTSTYCLQEKIENTEAALGGLKLVKLTQSEYEGLVTKDNSTLYVVTDS